MGLSGERWSDSGYKYINPIRFSDGLDVESQGKKESLRVKLSDLVLYCSVTNYTKFTEL